MSSLHKLKTWPEYFREVVSGRKPWEFRKDDRGYQEGDIVQLEEWDPKTEEYTGTWIYCRIAYIARGGVIPEGYCIFTLTRFTE